jgi:hypothetical protein
MVGRFRGSPTQHATQASEHWFGDRGTMPGLSTHTLKLEVPGEVHSAYSSELDETVVMLVFWSVCSFGNSKSKVVWISDKIRYSKKGQAELILAASLELGLHDSNLFGSVVCHTSLQSPHCDQPEQPQYCDGKMNASFVGLL